MKKPREFWIHENGLSKIAEDYPPDYLPTDKNFSIKVYHVREVIPIDWDKIWIKMNEEFGCNPQEESKLEQLVEAQLRGEE